MPSTWPSSSTNPRVELREFPPEVLAVLRKYADELVAELVDRDPLAAGVYASFSAYKAKAERWSALSEQAFLNSRRN